jgi:hypothetical protein
MVIQKLIMPIILAMYTMELVINLRSAPIHKIPQQNVPSDPKTMLSITKVFQFIENFNNKKSQLQKITL